MGNYRVPKREEFVKGFKYEILLTSGGGSWFFASIEDSKESIQQQVNFNRQPIIKEWIEKEYIYDSYIDELLNCPYSISYFLKNSLIRVKNGIE
jgi:hypothetical protein